MEPKKAPSVPNTTRTGSARTENSAVNVAQQVTKESSMESSRPKASTSGLTNQDASKSARNEAVGSKAASATAGASGLNKDAKTRPHVDIKIRYHAGSSSSGHTGSGARTTQSASQSLSRSTSSTSKDEPGLSKTSARPSSSRSASVAKPSSFDITMRKLSSKTAANVKEALVWIRKRYIKEKNGVERFQKAGGLSKLIAIIKSAEDVVVDIALSILGNCCMDDNIRRWMLHNEAIPVIVSMLRTSKVSSIQNRACRTLGNLSQDEHCAAAILGDESEDGETHLLETIVQLCKTCQDPDCLQTFMRTIRLLSSTEAHQKMVLEFEALSALGFLLNSDDDEVKLAALRGIRQLTTKLTIEHKRQLQIADVVSSLIKLTTSSNSTIVDTSRSLILQYIKDDEIRALFGNAGGIKYCLENIREQPESTTTRPLMHVLCQCCCESVNRFKVKEMQGLELLLDTLRGDSYRRLHGRIICALCCFMYDDEAMQLLLDKDLLSVLMSHLKKLTKIDKFDHASKLCSLSWVKVLESESVQIPPGNSLLTFPSVEHLGSKVNQKEQVMKREKAVQKRLAEVGVTVPAEQDLQRIEECVRPSIDQENQPVIGESGGRDIQVDGEIPGDHNARDDTRESGADHRYPQSGESVTISPNNEGAAAIVGSNSSRKTPEQKASGSDSHGGDKVVSHEDKHSDGGFHDLDMSDDDDDDDNTSGQDTNEVSGAGGEKTAETDEVQGPKYSMDSPTYRAVCEWNMDNKEYFAGPTNLRDSVRYYQTESPSYAVSSPVHLVPGSSQGSGSTSPGSFYNEPLSPSAYGSLALYSPLPSSTDSPPPLLLHAHDNSISPPVSPAQGPRSVSPPLFSSNPSSPQSVNGYVSPRSYSPPTSPARMSSHGSSSSLYSGPSSPGSIRSYGSTQSLYVCPRSPSSGSNSSVTGLLSCDEDFSDEEFSQVVDDDSDEDDGTEFLLVEDKKDHHDDSPSSAHPPPHTGDPGTSASATDTVASVSGHEGDCVASCGQTDAASTSNQVKRLSLKRKGHDNGPEAKRAKMMRKVESSHRRKSTLDIDSLMTSLDREKAAISCPASQQESAVSKSPEKVLVHKLLTLICHIAERRDPTKLLVRRDVWACLCNYLLYSSDPLPRCAMIMNRISRNKLCFESFVLHFLPNFLYFVLSDSYLMYVQGELKTLHGSYNTSEVPNTPPDQKDHSKDGTKTEGSILETLSSTEVHSTKQGSLRESDTVTRVGVGGAKLDGDNVSAKDSPDKIPTVSRKSRHLPGCLSDDEIKRRQKHLSKVMSDCCFNIVCTAESAYGLGVLAHLLHRGTTDLQRRVGIVTPYILNTGYARKFIFIRHNGLDYLWDAVDNSDDKPTQTLAILSLLHLGQSIGLSGETVGAVSLPSASGNGVSQHIVDLCFVMDDGSELMANKETLVSSFPVFSAMLSGFYKESNQSRVAIPNVRSDSFKLILQHMHGVDLCYEGVKDCEGWIEALTLAHQYMLPLLLQQISEVLVSDHLNMDTLSDVLTTSALCDCNWLLRKCVVFLFTAGLNCAEFVSCWRKLQEKCNQTVFFKSIKSVCADQIRENCEI